jgi:tyrosyl-tRNA synthetase
VEMRSKKIAEQAAVIFAGHKVEFVNNYDWLAKISLLDFLREIGKNFTVNELIKKDAIARRLNSEVGLSYTEFAYPLLQGYDYLVLNRERGCDVQVGGSDQWGNMVAGVELIRRKDQRVAHVITSPLITDKATGKKFGKSEGNAVWLDAEKTSPYAFYQFWLNTSDINVIDYLKLFTFLTLDEIEVLAKAVVTNPGAREAQKQLAQAVTAFVHGAEIAHSVIKVSEILFGQGDINSLSVEEKEMVRSNAPTFALHEPLSIIDVLVQSGLASSNREARTFIESGAVTLAENKVETNETVVEITADNLMILRRGKKNYVVLYA